MALRKSSKVKTSKRKFLGVKKVIDIRVMARCSNCKTKFFRKPADLDSTEKCGICLNEGKLIKINA